MMKKIGIAVIVIVVLIAAAIVIKNEVKGDVAKNAGQRNSDEVFNQLKKHLPKN
jgi:hypothetical protein